MRKIQVYLIIVFAACSLNTWSQSFDSILSKLDEHYKQEKLHLHFDRSVYTAGETIWFKAYLFTGDYPSLISKTIYTDLIDEKGKIIEHKSAPVLSSGAAGAFDIPSGYKGSLVYVRAYTKWMLNFDSSFIYTKAIPVATQAKAKLQEATKVSLHFFPEGGDLVQEVSSLVAFKAVDNTGMPATISGDIIDNKGKILSFASVHDGMGTFALLPKKGQTYKAIWKDNSGKVHETLLPIPKPNGVVLEVNNNSNQIEFSIRWPEGNDLPYPFVYIVAQKNNQLLYRAKANFSKTNVVQGVIPSDKFSTGIVQITLFTPDQKPIAERITFVNQFSSVFATNVNATLKNLDKRKKNLIQIDVPDTISTNLSVAITDADLDPAQEGDNILSRILLTSDIKEYVHNPAYYFSSEADSVLDHLDLVMMTNGWRRFNWDKVLANQWPKIVYPPDNYLAIEGQVSGLNKTLLANQQVNGIILWKNQKREFINTDIQAAGKFVFPEMVYYDTAKLFYQFNNDKKKDLTLKATFNIKNNLLKTPVEIMPDRLSLSRLTMPDTAILAKNIEIYNEQLSSTELQKVKTLTEVKVTTTKKTKVQLMDEEYASGAFASGSNARTILPEEDPAFLASPSLLNYLQGRIAGLEVDLSVTENAISRRGQTVSLFVNEIPQFILSMNGSMAEDASYLLSIPMSDIAMVKIFDPPFVGASGAGRGGAIAVYLKKGITPSEMKGLEYVYIPGYSPVKEFFSPDYSKVDQPSSADLRKTLYWNPFVITDKKNRRILLPFYNNDFTKRTKIIIEGCNDVGKVTRVEKVLQ